MSDAPPVRKWPVPQPRWDWGTGLVTCIDCPNCDWGAASMNSDKLDEAYRRHWWLDHENQNWSA